MWKMLISPSKVFNGLRIEGGQKSIWHPLLSLMQINTVPNLHHVTTEVLEQWVVSASAAPL